MRKELSISLITSLVLLDQLSKFLIRHFGGFYVCNSGIAFGIGISKFIPLLFFLIILLLIYKFGNFNLENRGIGIILIFSGAFSNLLDRFISGCVIDFIKLPFWPIFNLADIFISIGAIIILFKILFPKKEIL